MCPFARVAALGLVLSLISGWGERAAWGGEAGERREHWAYEAPVRPRVPAVRGREWMRNEVDGFILARLEERGWKPAPEADRATLLRRVSLDLTGLPPTAAEVRAFEVDGADGAYERQVDRLLASPRFGERMAQDWLDAARYADSNGYQVDRDRELWAWRDWVIRAFNTNQPFDQFTVEQLAGDLLPGATFEQRIATGFHRNHMINEEGGIIPEEFLVEYCADRVETTATVWLGLTMNCARCHDHKSDPFTQRDYYGLFAFFHNVPESGVGTYGASIRRNTPPYVMLPDARAEAELSVLTRELERERAGLARLEGGPASAERETLRKKVESLQKRVEAVELSVPISLVMSEMAEPRPTHVLMRGVYDRKGERVRAGTPAKLPPFLAGEPTNRLGLARWLVAPENPLTARVTVNRGWQLVFGAGLVRTSEDFGVQGERPSHPELLDWLATEFVRTGWDVKRLLRLLVTSATYRQDSRWRGESAGEDPENRWLARGPRYRWSAEAIRDQALRVSGLLVDEIGGPSVKPYHPPGLYEQVVAGSSASTYVQDHGASLYRRTLYTYWKRSVPNPAMLVFDMPFRETCAVRRARTTTPLQALNLMNDPTYVEAARALAVRMMEEGGADLDSRIRHGFRRVTGRAPTDRELSILAAGWRRARMGFEGDSGAARGLLAVGESRVDERWERTELAAYAVVASTLLNLDEAVTKE